MMVLGEVGTTGLQMLSSVKFDVVFAFCRLKAKFQSTPFKLQDQLTLLYSQSHIISL